MVCETGAVKVDEGCRRKGRGENVLAMESGGEVVFFCDGRGVLDEGGDVVDAGYGAFVLGG